MKYETTATHYVNYGRNKFLEITRKKIIPEGTEFVIGSAEGRNAAISYSIDGGRYFMEPPVTYVAARPDGTTEKRPAPAAMYTHVKWTLTRPIPPGGAVPVTMRVRVAARRAGAGEPAR